MNFPLLTGVCSSVHALLLHAHKCEACQIKMELLNGQWRIATRDGLASIDAIPPPWSCNEILLSPPKWRPRGDSSPPWPSLTLARLSLPFQNFKKKINSNVFSQRQHDQVLLLRGWLHGLGWVGAVVFGGEGIELFFPFSPLRQEGQLRRDPVRGRRALVLLNLLHWYRRRGRRRTSQGGLLRRVHVVRKPRVGILRRILRRREK